MRREGVWVQGSEVAEVVILWSRGYEGGKTGGEVRFGYRLG